MMILLLIVAGGAYSYFQYKQGLSQANDGKFEDDKKNEEQFKGDLPENGKINVLCSEVTPGGSAFPDGFHFNRTI